MLEENSRAYPKLKTFALGEKKPIFPSGFATVVIGISPKFID